MSKLVKGTMLLTAATFLSKILGMIYVIPFNQLVGAKGGALFSYAYIPYSTLLTLSTVGVPLAVSKFVAKYNSLEDYKTGLHMYKIGLYFMGIMGFIAFSILFFGADGIATLINPNEVSDISLVMRMTSFALLIVPAMSISRGFFQGYESMEPTAISQVVEQLVRITFLLLAVIFVIKVFNGTVVTAVGFATFASFIGAVSSCFVLYVFWRKKRRYIMSLVQKQSFSSHYKTKTILLELLGYAGPFVLVGIATSLYQLIDEFTFHKAMAHINQESVAHIAFSVINYYGHKVVILPVTVAIGLSSTLVPTMTQTFTNNNYKMLYKQINQSLQIVLFLVFPASIGIALLSNMIYGSLFDLSHINITGPLLGWYAPVALLFALYTVSSAILQGINEQRFAVISLGSGLLIKVILNIQFIHTFGAKGAVFATALAVSTAVLLNLWKIKSAVSFSYKQTMKRFSLIVIFTISMCIVIAVLNRIIGPFEESKSSLILWLLIDISIGGIIYFFLSYKSSLINHILGKEINLFALLFRKKK